MEAEEEECAWLMAEEETRNYEEMRLKAESGVRLALESRRRAEEK